MLPIRTPAARVTEPAMCAGGTLLSETPHLQCGGAGDSTPCVPEGRIVWLASHTHEASYRRCDARTRACACGIYINRLFRGVSPWPQPHASMLSPALRVTESAMWCLRNRFCLAPSAVAKECPQGIEFFVTGAAVALRRRRRTVRTANFGARKAADCICFIQRHAAGYKNQTRRCFTTSSRLDNKPIIITFLAMEKVILLCTL